VHVILSLLALTLIIRCYNQMWHEIPKSYQQVGQFPGAPMHCHRGFCEMPYCKEISGGNSDKYGYFLAKDHTGASSKVGAGDDIFHVHTGWVHTIAVPFV
jgi:hypothetical protein